MEERDKEVNDIFVYLSISEDGDPGDIFNVDVGALELKCLIQPEEKENSAFQTQA